MVAIAVVAAPIPRSESNGRHYEVEETEGFKMLGVVEVDFVDLESRFGDSRVVVCCMGDKLGEWDESTFRSDPIRSSKRR